MDTWVGHYEGKMYLEFPNSKKDSLFLSLDIITLEEGKAWTQKFTYSSTKYGDMVKDYKLVLNPEFSDGEHYFLDEQNGILIDEIMLHETLLSHYEVQENYYQTRLEKKGKQLYFEIVCSKIEGGTKSSATENDEVFNVNSSLIYTIQYSTLAKTN